MRDSNFALTGSESVRSPGTARGERAIVLILLWNSSSAILKGLWGGAVAQPATIKVLVRTAVRDWRFMISLSLLFHFRVVQLFQIALDYRRVRSHWARGEIALEFGPGLAAETLCPVQQPQLAMSIGIARVLPGRFLVRSDGSLDGRLPRPRSPMYLSDQKMCTRSLRMPFQVLLDRAACGLEAPQVEVQGRVVQKQLVKAVEEIFGVDYQCCVLRLGRILRVEEAAVIADPLLEPWMSSEEKRFLDLLLVEVLLEKFDDDGGLLWIIAGDDHRSQSLHVCLGLQFPRVSTGRGQGPESSKRAGESFKSGKHHLEYAKEGGLVLQTAHLLHRMPMREMGQLVAEHRGQLSLIFHTG